MEIKFFTGERILDLSGQKITTQDTNSRMNDKMFSKYLFPFEIYMNEDFVNSFGDYESDDAFELENTFDGVLLFENNIHQAKLVLLSVEGKLLTGQIDFGFEDLPNFDKKLAELPLHKFSVPDIYTFAKEIAAKNYPATDFNFPRMYTSKYPPDQEVWDAFDGYYNDLTADGSDMRRNHIDENGNVFNVNIVHPTPHFLYVLKTGFADAGLTLAGDILTDPIFSQRWMFSGTEYFSRLSQLRNRIEVSCNDYTSVEIAGQMCGAKYVAHLGIAKKGRYKIRGLVRLYWSRKVMPRVSCDLYLNNVKIWNVSRKEDIEETFNIELDVTSEDSILRWDARSAFMMGENFNVLEMEAIGQSLDQSESQGEDNGVIVNINEVDLTRAVPDMTFGDFVNAIRNRFNYGVDVVDNLVYMNRLGTDPTDVKDFSQFEVGPAFRKKTLLQKRSFLLRSPDLGDTPQPAMFFDKDGAFLNKEPKAETIIIESNIIILQTGVPKPGGYDTAIITKDTQDAVQLVWYDGLTGVQNNAKNPPGADFPELFYSHWEKWLQQRVRGYEYHWKFYCVAEKFDYRISDYIFAYNNIHNIKTWTKDLVGETYEVDMVTETV